MRQSQLFGKTMREAPKSEVAANAGLLERGGFIYKSMAGVYEYLPLGFRVLQKINRCIREEMDAIGGQEILLAGMQSKERWERTGRWDVMKDIMYQFKDHSGRDIGLATTHEEVITQIATRFVASYKDLPFSVYQIQTKFRDEPRAKSGLIRGREFFMKDLYSFHRDEKDLNRFYAAADRAYKKIFKRCELDVYVTEASGGTFTTQYTHEYQVLSDAGEDWIIYCLECGFAQNREISTLKEGNTCTKCGKGVLTLGRSIEAANIFKLGTKFSDAFGLLYTDESGKRKPVVMGSYGIGTGRLMATVVEIHHDERGIRWPDSIAPFSIHVIQIGEEGRVRKEAMSLYEKLLAQNVEVLYDNRDDKTAGEKFADADLIGIPLRTIISQKTIEKGGVEIKQRDSEKTEIVSYQEFMKKLKKP